MKWIVCRFNHNSSELTFVSYSYLFFVIIISGLKLSFNIKVIIISNIIRSLLNNVRDLNLYHNLYDIHGIIVIFLESKKGYKLESLAIFFTFVRIA